MIGSASQNAKDVLADNTCTRSHFDKTGIPSKLEEAFCTVFPRASSMLRSKSSTPREGSRAPRQNGDFEQTGRSPLPQAWPLKWSAIHRYHWTLRLHQAQQHGDSERNGPLCFDLVSNILTPQSTPVLQIWLRQNGDLEQVEHARIHRYR